MCVCEERARTQTHDATANEQRRRQSPQRLGWRGNRELRARVQINAKQLPLAVRYQSVAATAAAAEAKAEAAAAVAEAAAVKYSQD